MDDDCDKDIEDGDVGSFEGHLLNSQVLSNITCTLQDPIVVPCRGRPNSLRQKHPKEKQGTVTRTCSICKQICHVRSNCPSHRQTRSSYFYYIIFQFIILYIKCILTPQFFQNVLF